MKFGKHKIEKVYNFDVDFEDKEYAFLQDYGLREIQKDPEALINYAVNSILAKTIKTYKPLVIGKQKKIVK